jgi:hypothetical protein
MSPFKFEERNVRVLRQRQETDKSDEGRARGEEKRIVKDRGALFHDNGKIKQNAGGGGGGGRRTI